MKKTKKYLSRSSQDSNLTIPQRNAAMLTGPATSILNLMLS
jgi:hypothetical protein